ncbi:hypothetical protein VNO80_18515 [Phaseolus coccineus]|uniref:Uncharacterized protein n=1 Tax=Phaseolus coccineus TaxID=3886 RepID=A0AAN9MHV8_PHACN
MGKIAVSALLAVLTGVHGTNDISKGKAVMVLVLLCIYAADFGWSWGPLTWLSSAPSCSMCGLDCSDTLFIIFFLPETKGIPLESMHVIWAKHWFWRRFVTGVADKDNLP